MMKHHLLIAVGFVAIVHFGVADISTEDLRLPIFHKADGHFSQKRVENVTGEILGYLRTGAAGFKVFAEVISKRFLDSAKLSKTGKTLIKYAPLVGQLATVVFDVMEFVKEGTIDKLKPLYNYVDEHNTKMIQDGALRTIKRKINLMHQTLIWIKQESNYEKQNVKDLCGYLIEINDIFTDEYYQLREIPSVVVPILLSLTPIAAMMATHMQSLNLTECVSCKFAATIEQYFQPFLLDRFNKIDVDMGSYGNRGYANKYKYALDANFMAPRNSWKHRPILVRDCELRDGDTSKVNLPSYIVIKDKFLSEYEKYLVCRVSPIPVTDYMTVVRYEIQQKFEEAFQLVNQTCIKPLKPTGRGWAHWYIGAIKIHDGFNCGDVDRCDPYVEILINNRPKFVSTKKQNVQNFVWFDEMYHTRYNETIYKDNSTFTIRVWDDDSEAYVRLLKDIITVDPDDEIISESFDMGTNMSRELVKENEMKLFYIGYWTDEYPKELSADNYKK